MGFAHERTRTCTGLACAVLGMLAGCTSPLTPPPIDAGADALGTLSLSVSMVPPVLSGLVVTSSEVTLERLGIFGDVSNDQRTQLARTSFTFADAPQVFSFPMAPPGIYSTIGAEIDHVSIDGTWNGTPLSIRTAGEERIFNQRDMDQELSASQSAQFHLVIDSTHWLSATTLNSVPIVAGSIQINTTTSPSVVNEIMDGVLSSFAPHDE